MTMMTSVALPTIYLLVSCLFNEAFGAPLTVSQTIQKVDGDTLIGCGKIMKTPGHIEAKACPYRIFLIKGVALKESEIKAGSGYRGTVEFAIKDKITNAHIMSGTVEVNDAGNNVLSVSNVKEATRENYLNNEEFIKKVEARLKEIQGS